MAHLLRLKNIFRAQLATCCVSVTDPDGAADLPIFRAAITDKNDHTAFNAIMEGGGVTLPVSTLLNNNKTKIVPRILVD